MIAYFDENWFDGAYFTLAPAPAPSPVSVFMGGRGGGGSVGGRISGSMWTGRSRISGLKPPSTFNCPYCEFVSNVINLAGHIRESHPDKLIGISKMITRALSLGYSDIEALILPPEEIAPEKYAGKPLIAQETISIRVKKESKYAG